MERIAVAGLSIHQAGVGELERVAARLERVGAASGVEDELLRDLADAIAASEIVLVRTCNRIEVVFARESGARPSPRDRGAVADALAIEDERLRESLVFHRGRSAVRHVFRVTSSLESLVVGEDQILGQVRAAFTRSREIGLVGPLLAPVFEAALQVGKRVRTSTELSRHPVSVVALGVRALRDEPWESDRPPRIAIVGAGRTGRLAGHALEGEGWRASFVVNRSRDRGAALARELGARSLSLDEFRRGDEPVDVVVSATSAPGFVLEAADLRRLARPGRNGAENGSRPARLIGIDLAMPRDLEPVDEPGVRIIDLDALRSLAEENRCLREAAAVQAEAIVERKLDVLARRVAEHRIETLAGEILAETSEALEHELRALSNGRLAGLDEEELRSVERWARRTFGRLAHAPLSAFKRLSHELSEVLEEDEEETVG